MQLKPRGTSQSLTVCLYEAYSKVKTIKINGIFERRWCTKNEHLVNHWRIITYDHHMDGLRFSHMSRRHTTNEWHDHASVVSCLRCKPPKLCQRQTVQKTTISKISVPGLKNTHSTFSGGLPWVYRPMPHVFKKLPSS